MLYQDLIFTWDCTELHKLTQVWGIQSIFKMYCFLQICCNMGVVVVPVNQYIFNQPITAPYLPNQPITIHFLLSSDWSIQISSPLIGQHPKENIRPRPGEHPVFTLIGQSKTAFAFPSPSTNHRQTETTVAKSTAPNKPTSPTPIHPSPRATPGPTSPPPTAPWRPVAGAPSSRRRGPRPVAAAAPAPSPADRDARLRQPRWLYDA